MSNLHIATSRRIAFALASVLLLATAMPAAAQTAPYTAYGVGLKAGAKITASVGGVSCGPGATTDVAGNWIFRITTTDPCSPKEGDTISFAIDGAPAEQTVKWTAGGAPANVTTGIALTAATSGFSGGTIAPTGVSIVAFTGTTAQLNAAGVAAKAVSITATSGGKMLTFVVGAPDFVNSGFTTAFPSGLTGALVIVKT